MICSHHPRQVIHNITNVLVLGIGKTTLQNNVMYYVSKITSPFPKYALQGKMVKNEEERGKLLCEDNGI